MNLVLTRGREGVNNPKNLADVIYVRRLNDLRASDGGGAVSAAVSIHQIAKRSS